MGPRHSRVSFGISEDPIGAWLASSLCVRENSRDAAVVNSVGFLSVGETGGTATRAPLCDGPMAPAFCKPPRCFPKTETTRTLLSLSLSPRVNARARSRRPFESLRVPSRSCDASRMCSDQRIYACARTKQTKQNKNVDRSQIGRSDHGTALSRAERGLIATWFRL